MELCMSHPIILGIVFEWRITCNVSQRVYLNGETSKLKAKTLNVISFKQFISKTMKSNPTGQPRERFKFIEFHR